MICIQHIAAPKHSYDGPALDQQLESIWALHKRVRLWFAIEELTPSQASKAK